ncbi:hypothetical protein MIMGU_mgv11b019488mg, partial [Erythranthe guttata]
PNHTHSNSWNLCSKRSELTSEEIRVSPNFGILITQLHDREGDDDDDDDDGGTFVAPAA